jgi:hypothetical protein
MIPRNLAAFELVELMAAGRLITTEQEHKLAIEIEKAPDEKLDEILIRSGNISAGELESVKLASRLIKEGRIDKLQFAVAISDERSVGIKMEESLIARGWLTEADLKAIKNSTN